MWNKSPSARGDTRRQIVLFTSNMVGIGDPVMPQLDPHGNDLRVPSEYDAPYASTWPTGR